MRETVSAIDCTYWHPMQSMPLWCPCDSVAWEGTRDFSLTSAWVQGGFRALEAAENSLLWSLKGSSPTVGTAVPDGIPQTSFPGESGHFAGSAAVRCKQKWEGCIHELPVRPEPALPRRRKCGTEGPAVKSRYKDRETDNYSQCRHAVAWSNSSNKETEETSPTLQQRGLN